jgi:hypothetical protein
VKTVTITHQWLKDTCGQAASSIEAVTLKSDATMMKGMVVSRSPKNGIMKILSRGSRV